MLFTPLHALIAFAAALAAGVVNTLAGGGSILTFPTLLWLGLPAVSADATNIFGIWAGNASGAWGLRRSIATMERRWLWLLAPSLIGGTVGAWLLLHTTDRAMQRIAPWLILAATVLFALEGPLRALEARFWGQNVAGHRVHAAGGEIAGGEAAEFRRAARRREREIGRGGPALSPEMIAATERSASGTVGPAGLETVAVAPHGSGISRRRWRLLMLSQFAIAVYGGYFGAGVGILMLAAMGLTGLRDLRANIGLKNLLAVMGNGIAIAWYVPSHRILWPFALICALGAALGGWTGARITQRISHERARWTVVAVGVFITLLLALRMG